MAANLFYLLNVTAGGSVNWLKLSAKILLSLTNLKFLSTHRRPLLASIYIL